MAEVSFDNIRHQRVTGKLSLVPGFVIWRQVISGHIKRDTLMLSEFQKVTFLKVSKSSWLLDIIMQNDTFFRFGGFINTDKDKAATFFRDQGMPVVEEEISVSGRNFGDLELTGNCDSMIVENQTALCFNLDRVSKVKTTSKNKNDVTIEFQTDFLKNYEEKDSLLEMSFHIPDTNLAFGGKESINPAQAFKNLLESKQGIVYSNDEADAMDP